MRSITIGVSVFAVLVSAAGPAVSQQQPAPPRLQANDLADQIILTDVAIPPLSSNEITGLSTADRPATLTWEQIYALALIRARARRGAFAPTLDLAALAEESARYGVGDFARFRVDFAASGTFRDPGPAVLELERRLLAIDSTHRTVASLENLSKLIVEQSQGKNSGVSRIDVDAVAASLLRARQKLAGEIGQFRDGLDDLKFLLGLSPTALVVVDRQAVAAFPELFGSVESWGRNSNRNLGDLSRLIAQCPEPGEILLNGLRVLERLDKNPELLEYFLKVAAQRALKSRSERDQIVVQPNSGIQLELRVRRRIRAVFDKRRAFEGEKRRYEMAIRLRDQSFERLFAPPTPVVNSRSLLVAALLEQLAQVLESQDRLAGLWTSFRAERLSLYRDLGDLPYNDWKGFFADLSAVPVTAPAHPATEPKPGKGAAAPLKPPISRAR